MVAFSISSQWVNVMANYLVDRLNSAHNSGDDFAGTVVSVGKDVYEFRVGDKVAAFHEPRTPGGSFGEYALANDSATFHIPHNISFEGVFCFSCC
jgi:NADPH:quinone reductase-like Zn-dependent oxidoreductase